MVLPTSLRLIKLESEATASILEIPAADANNKPCMSECFRRKSQAWHQNNRCCHYRCFPKQGAERLPRAQSPHNHSHRCAPALPLALGFFPSGVALILSQRFAMLPLCNANQSGKKQNHLEIPSLSTRCSLREAFPSRLKSYKKGRLSAGSQKSEASFRAINHHTLIFLRPPTLISQVSISIIRVGRSKGLNKYP